MQVWLKKYITGFFEVKKKMKKEMKIGITLPKSLFSRHHLNLLKSQCCFLMDAYWPYARWNALVVIEMFLRQSKAIELALKSNRPCGRHTSHVVAKQVLWVSNQVQPALWVLKQPCEHQTGPKRIKLAQWPSTRPSHRHHHYYHRHHYHHQPLTI